MKNILNTLQLIIFASFISLVSIACNNKSSKNNSKCLSKKKINLSYICQYKNRIIGFFKNSFCRFWNFSMSKADTVTEEDFVDVDAKLSKEERYLKILNEVMQDKCLEKVVLSDITYQDPSQPSFDKSKEFLNKKEENHIYSTQDYHELCKSNNDTLPNIFNFYKYGFLIHHFDSDNKFREENSKRYNFDPEVNSKASKHSNEFIKNIFSNKSNLPLVFTGASGKGKTLLSKAIYNIITKDEHGFITDEKRDIEKSWLDLPSIQDLKLLNKKINKDKNKEYLIILDDVCFLDGDKSHKANLQNISLENVFYEQLNKLIISSKDNKNVHLVISSNENLKQKISKLYENNINSVDFIDDKAGDIVRMENKKDSILNWNKDKKYFFEKYLGVNSASRLGRVIIADKNVFFAYKTELIDKCNETSYSSFIYKDMSITESGIAMKFKGNGKDNKKRILIVENKNFFDDLITKKQKLVKYLINTGIDILVQDETMGFKQSLKSYKDSLIYNSLLNTMKKSPDWFINRIRRSTFLATLKYNNTYKGECGIPMDFADQVGSFNCVYNLKTIIPEYNNQHNSKQLKIVSGFCTKSVSFNLELLIKFINFNQGNVYQGAIISNKSDELELKNKNHSWYNTNLWKKICTYINFSY